jgi:hypothetical protein
MSVRLAGAAIAVIAGASTLALAQVAQVAPGIATADQAPAKPARVEVLTIDTRNTGVDLGLRRLPDGSYAPRLRTAVAQPAARFAASPAAVAPLQARTVDAVAPPVLGDPAARGGNASVQEATHDASAAPADTDAVTSDGSAVESTSLDAPLSAEGMSLDALTAAAAAEATRNRNGTLVRGRITPAY